MKKFLSVLLAGLLLCMSLSAFALTPEDFEAAENACKMEHIVSEKFFDNFSKFSDFISEYSRLNPDFIEKYKKLIK